MFRVSGVTGCGPLFRDIMLTLENNSPNYEFTKIDGLIEIDICPESGKLADKNCPGTMTEIFITGTEPITKCTYHQHQDSQPSQLSESKPIHSDFPTTDLTITSPRDGDIFKIDPILRRSYQTVRFMASVPKEFPLDRMEWWINGKKKSETDTQSPYSWKLQPGLYTIIVLIRNENRVIKSRPVSIRVL